MQHGDIVVRLSLYGEPQKLLTYWRGSLPDMLPTGAAISILKTNKKRVRTPWYADYVPDFHFEEMTRSEKKRAELSISEKSLSMSATEIATARHLTDITFEWISGRGVLPTLNQPMPNARLSLKVDGSSTLVDMIERIGDPEVVSVASVGAVYTQGEPRRPDVRWLPELKGIDKTMALDDLKFFEGSLAEGQADELRRMVDRVRSVFAKALNLRKAKLNKRISDVFGYGPNLEIEGRPITDAMIEGSQYENIMRWLQEEKGRQKPKGSIRA
jgi:hypothetical protein